jgi:hypothetical protein
MKLTLKILWIKKLILKTFWINARILKTLSMKTKKAIKAVLLHGTVKILYRMSLFRVSLCWETLRQIRITVLNVANILYKFLMWQTFSTNLTHSFECGKHSLQIQITVSNVANILYNAHPSKAIIICTFWQKNDKESFYG